MTDYNSDNEDDHTIDCEDEEDVEDDEATLDEEDALNDEEDYGNELKELQEDGELSLEELRRKYCVNEEKEEIAKTSKVEDENEVKNVQASSLSSTRGCNTVRGKILTAIASTCDVAVNNYFKSDDLEEDESEDYLPPELWKKEVRIGQDYQVSNIPKVEKMTENYKQNTNENCKPLWIASPECCPESLITEYLIECEHLRAGETPKNFKKQNFSSETVTTEEEIVPDDENALYALYLANYNVKIAKLKAPFEWPAICSINGPQLTQPPGPLRTWSEEECESFEKGMSEYGKQFLKIQRDYLPKRTIGELVSFYYSWKKSERYTIWQQNRREIQHVDVKCVDLMGQIAESILRQTQVENDEQIIEKELNRGEEKNLENNSNNNLKIENSPSSSG